MTNVEWAVIALAMANLATLIIAYKAHTKHTQ